MDWVVLFSPVDDPACNLALEECFLEGSYGPDESILLFYVNRPSLIIGKHQNPWTEVAWEVLEEKTIPLYRRVTGGGAVYHDGGNLNFSFITLRAVFSKEDNLDRVRRGLNTLGVPLSRTGRGDLFYGERKVSGNALCFRKERVLHHGTLLIDSDLRTLRKAFDVSRESRSWFRSPAVASVPSPTMNLKEQFPHLSIPMVMEAVARQFSPSSILAAGLPEKGFVSQPHCPAEQGPLVSGVLGFPLPEAFNQIVERHRSKEWVWGGTPSFWFCPPPGEAEYRVEGGKIVEARGEAPRKDLIGKEFDPNLWVRLTYNDFALARRAP